MVIGHEKQREFLKRSAAVGKLSHAYLFTGEEHLGKRKVAIEWASYLLKEEVGNKVENSQHPDLILIEPLPEKKEIEIGQIRDLIWKLSLKPYSAPLKIAIIDKAHLMNTDSQNCFLKTLEEPKENTLIILISEYPEMLLPTVLSRCERIKFYPIKKEEIINYLKTRALAKREDENKVLIAYRAKRRLEMNERSSTTRTTVKGEDERSSSTTRTTVKGEDERSSSTGQNISEEEIEKIAKTSLGKPGVAVDFIENPQKLQDFEAKIKEIIKVSHSDLTCQFQYAKDVSQNSEPLEILNIWLSYFREILLKKCLSSEGQPIDYSIANIKNIIKTIQNTIFFISTTNVNSKLALEILMLSI